VIVARLGKKSFNEPYADYVETRVLTRAWLNL
jgi:hypothetical protein